MDWEETEASHSFGQKVPPLYVEIKEVLQEYPDGQVFKEIIQNADDAGARTVRFYLDSRHHGTQSLVHRDLTRFQGPALLAYNDAEFKAGDWDGIQSFKISGKKEDPFKVGKFGIGFNSVYHITDLPIILSSSTLAFLEPHEEVWEGKSGRKFTLSECHSRYRDSLIPFNGICGFSCGTSTYPGTIFRFPLRDTPSKLSDNIYSVEKLKKLTDALKSDAKLLLLFLRSVDTIEVHEIGRDGRHQQVFRVAISEPDKTSVQQERKRFMDKLRAEHGKQSYSISQCVDLEVSFHIQVTNGPIGYAPAVSTHWLVTNLVGCPIPEVLAAAKKQLIFPWVGAALELTEHPSQENGRVFCFLPLPNDASSQLPVHLNGTFGVSSNRRSLKWTGREARNDQAAQWNELLVKHLIPPCYEKLLVLAKPHLTAEQFYRNWPKVSFVSRTPWKELLLPLFQSLFRQPSLWVGPPLQQWIIPQQGIFVPEHDSEFPAVVERALANCRVKLVRIPQVIWDALRHSGCQVSSVTPGLTRQTIRGNINLSYSGFTSKEKQMLLTYCLSDNNYSDLQNLALLPMANGTFASFQSSRMYAQAYICSTDTPRELLPNLDHLLVDLSQENPKLHKVLVKVAGSNQTHLQLLSVQSVAQLFPSCMPASWRSQKTVSLPSGSYPLDWFQTFWEWVRRHNHNLQYFASKLVVPVSTGAGQRKFDITRLSRESAVVYLPRSGSCHADLRQALIKLQVKFTDQNDFPYVNHRQLLDHLYKYTANDVLSAIACIYRGREDNIQYVVFTSDEAHRLLSFLSLCSSYLDSGQQQVLRNLPIFTALGHSELFSVRKASQQSCGHKAILEPQTFDISHSCIPYNLIILSRSYQASLLEVMREVETPNQLELLLNTVFPMVSRGQYPGSQLDSLMMEVLRLVPVLKFQFPRRQSDLTSTIGGLCFIKTSDCIRKAPKELFDPSVADLKGLYQGEPVFPGAPFNDREYRLCLRACGVQTTVKGQQIISIIESICKKKSASPMQVEGVRLSRAKAVLKYLSSCSSQAFNEKVMVPSVSHRDWYPLSQAISILASRFNWLPVCSKPPETFPDCLTWKGRACTTHLVSLTSDVLLPTRDNSDTLPGITGSQMYVVDCSLSDDLYSHLTSSCQGTASLADIALHAWNHFKLVIQHCRYMERKALDTIVCEVYDYLEKHGDRIRELYDAKWIWIRKFHTFVSPNVSSLQENATFPHSLEPYLYVIPEGLAQDYSTLFRRYGVQKEMTQSQIVSVLSVIKGRERPEADGKKAMNMVLDILKWLTNDEELPEFEDGDTLYVPVQTTSNYPELVEPEEAVYTDIKFLQEYVESSDLADEYAFVDRRINVDMARLLQVTPLSKHLNISDDSFEDVGQHEPLITRLKNILEDYRDGVTIVKELLQNADDAEATEVNICYDARTHAVPPKNLFFAGMAQCHGPALVIHNDASFSKDDFVNITKLAGETKMDKPLKIGKFGVGFCSVYHITDVPSFVSEDMLYIFDPTMTYLGKVIKDPARPGQKIKFTDKIVVSSKQLTPFERLYGFDKTKLYRGTIFRLPFRTSPSDISGIVYKEGTVMQLVEDIRESSSQLLLFLQHVTKITFSQINHGESTPRLLFEVRRTTTTPRVDSPVSIHTIASSCHTSSPEQWLVATHSDDTVDFGSNHTYGTASVACLLDSVSSFKSYCGECYTPKAVTGEIFCFLPLAVHSGLPVHVSSNFAVMKSRKGIQASSDTSDTLAQFNAGLMEHIIPVAYCNLLKTLQGMCKEGEVLQGSYQFFSLWPLREELRAHNPWDKLIVPLYELISSSELFFSESMDEWCALAESEILAPGILTTESDVESIPECVIKVIKILKHRFVDLPERYRKQLPQDELDDCTVDEKIFLEVFFRNINVLAPKHSQETRNDVLKHILHMFGYVSNRSISSDPHRQDYLEVALRNNRCVPCAPDGSVLKYCKDVVNLNAEFSKLYDPEDHVFPVNEFCSNKLICLALAELGMVGDRMPWHMLAERAETVRVLYHSEQTKALERAQLVIECVSRNLSSQLESSVYELSVGSRSSSESEDVSESLAEIPFLPAMKKPEGYPLQWHGDNYDLLSGKELLYGGQENVNLAGSQLPLVFDESPRQGGCGYIPSLVRTKLGIKESPDCHTVIDQLYHVISVSRTLQTDQFSPVTTKWVEEICSAVYKYLNDPLEKGTADLTDLNRLKSRSCVWSGECFVSPTVVAKDWSHEGPYLFALPHTIRKLPKLADALGIREKFELDDFVKALERMHCDFLDQPVSDRCLQTVSVIIHEMNTPELPNDTVCFLPDDNSVMFSSSELAYNDAPWCQVEEQLRLVHKNIPRDLAISLGVKPIRSKILERYEDSTNSFMGVEFGQREELTQRIKNILTQYPCDETVLKELLQNADDAKATKMYVILDKRTHGKEKVLRDEWADLQGPALLVWNDSVFKEEDIQGIQKLGLGSKRSEEDSIGQYGIGFNVVYNLTDCPSFVTYCNGETLCVLDPHCRYVPGASKLKPGRRYNDLDERFWSNYADLKTAYLREGVKDCPIEMTTGGSLFRFPLRSTKELVQKSELVDRESSRNVVYSNPRLPMTAWRMDERVKKWAGEMKQALFFLNHVTELRFFVIEENSEKMSLTNWYEATLSEEAQACRVALHSKVKAFTKLQQVPDVVCYPLTLIERSTGMQGKQEEESESWLIQQGVGDLLKRDQEWRFAPQVKPKHGIAAPLKLAGKTRYFRGTVFCFLPLPISSHLPIHVNGNFILDSSRRDLWHSTKEDDPDDRTKWNRRLIEAIASSYVDFLARAQHFYVDPHHLFDDIKELLFGNIYGYYNAFPTWLKFQTKQEVLPPEGLFLSLAKSVYRKLENENSPVLVTIKVFPVPADSHPPPCSHKGQRSRTPRAQFSVEWHPLHNEEEPSKQVYFWKPSDKEMTLILDSIGMQLSAAPMFIRKHFKSLEIELSEATRETVFQYYSQFHLQASRLSRFPCHISDTAFKSVDRFLKFSRFLLDLPTVAEVEVPTSTFSYVSQFLSPTRSVRSEGNAFPKSPSSHPQLLSPSNADKAESSEFPEGLPLLLTADEQLRVFEEENMVICSAHHKVFSHSKDRFLHPKMVDLRYVPGYFVQACDDNWPMVEGILQRELPRSLEAVRVLNADSHINQSALLRPLWSCLSGDGVFELHLKNIVKTWALLLSTQNQLFAFRSWDQLLPVVAPKPRDEHSTVPAYDEQQYVLVFKVLQQAGIPVLDTSVVPRYTARSCCPTFSHPQRILTNLYYLHKVHTEEEGLTTLLSERDADRSIVTLFDYFKDIHFAQDPESLRKLKCLPLFKDVSGKLRTLEGEAYIWPHHICNAGSSRWLSEIAAIFLKRKGDWTKLGISPEVLGVREISVLKVYSEFIFPHFHLLSAEDRYKQLEHIRDQLFEDADNDKTSKVVERKSAAFWFISGLQTLPCLPLPDGELRPVGEFSDPEVPIFTTFCASFHFPPHNLQSPIWLQFLRKIGLRVKVTQVEYKEFCKAVSEGNHRELRKASNVLLKYLLKASDWYTKAAFLEEVSNIPFVLAEQLPSLVWIKSICPAENRIQQGRKTIDLTRLNGAALYRDCRRLVWTVKSVVELPSFEANTPKDTKGEVYNHLGIITCPNPCDVVNNVKNISASRFASFALFDKYRDNCKQKQKDLGSDCLLLSVLAENFHFLYKLHFDRYSESVLDPLREVPCIPVCAEGRTAGIIHPVLVKPLQVVADNSEIRAAHPFINPLPNDLYPFLQLLFKIGVENAIQPVHVRVALEEVHTHVKQPLLDPNTVEAVKYLLKKLYLLLKDSPKAALQKHADTLAPLYLPNADQSLVPTAQLICNDKHQYRNTPLDFSALQYSLFGLLVPNPQRDLGFSPRQLCSCLPSAVSPVLLSSCCEEELHSSCTETEIVSNSNAANDLQKTFELHAYIARATQLVLQRSAEAQECSKFTAALQDFLQKTRIVVYKNLQADIFLTLVTPRKKIGTAKVPFLVQKSDHEDETFCLCLDQTTSFGLLEPLASSIVSCVAQVCGVDQKALCNPEETIKKLLVAKYYEDIENFLESMDIPLESLALEGVDIPVSRQPPKLGDPIPPEWHHLLEQDLNNIFRPEELVGYEQHDNDIVLARVVYRIPTGVEEEGEKEEKEEGEKKEEEKEEEEEEGFAKYLIRTREDDEVGKTVSVLDLYKFTRTEDMPVEDCHEVAIPEDSDAARLMTSLHEQEGSPEWKRIKKEVCADLRRIWRLPEDERRKGIKRLYLKWHPDKNRHPLATKAFQFLKQQIARLQKGLPLDQDDDEGEGYQPPPSWSPWWNMWDDIASRHRRTRDRGGGGGGWGGWGYGGGGGLGYGRHVYWSWLHETMSRPNVPTARVWLRQAEVDMRIMETVLAKVDIFPDHAAHTCFLAHEVAEKALKAGKYATSGLDPGSLMFHHLVGHAGALEQMEPRLTTGLRTNARALENYYTETRFPNRYTPPCVPADRFTPDQARDAHRIAEKILQMMREVVGQAQ